VAAGAWSSGVDAAVSVMPEVITYNAAASKNVKERTGNNWAAMQLSGLVPGVITLCPVRF
jgi:hypothetical protein